MGTIIAAEAGERVGELMPEAELDTRIEVVGELATLDAVVGTFQLDRVVGCVHHMEPEENPIIAGNKHTAVAHFVFVAVAIKQLLLEIEDRRFVLVGGYHDRRIGSAGLGEA